MQRHDATAGERLVIHVRRQDEQPIRHECIDRGSTILHHVIPGLIGSCILDISIPHKPLTQ